MGGCEASAVTITITAVVLRCRSWATSEILKLANDLFGNEVPADAAGRYGFSVDEELWVPVIEKVLAKLEWLANESKTRFGATKTEP